MYSYFIRCLRILLPLALICILGLLFAWPWITKPSLDSHIEKPQQESRILAREISERDIITSGQSDLAEARFTGRDSAGRPYVITAIQAVTDDRSTDPTAGKIHLDQAMADIFLDQDEWLALRADKGEYNPKRQRLDLRGSIEIFHDSGYTLETEALHADLGSGTLYSTDSTTLQGPIGRLEAEGMKASPRFEKIEFPGPSRLVLWSSDRAE